MLARLRARKANDTNAGSRYRCRDCDDSIGKLQLSAAARPERPRAGRGSDFMSAGYTTTDGSAPCPCSRCARWVHFAAQDG